MPFPDGSFSGVVAFTMLHHMATAAAQDSLFSEARRVLCPGGVFAGFDGVDSLLFRLVHLGDGYLPVEPGTFGSRLQTAGFTGVTIEQRSRRFRFQAKRP
jgi:SAM-dependent methyltransferase